LETTASVHPVPGQRWLSDTETELGLGIILSVDAGRVTIFFPAASEHRVYALANNPLRRIQFNVGDRIFLHDESEVAVTGLSEQEGLLVYEAGDRQFQESEIADSMNLSTPWDRLLNGRVDELRTFDQRCETVRWRHTIRSSPVRGFVGGRVDMIPHQMSIAGEVAGRLLPRVLLADEVGLGKTIEAGLILHRLHLTGRAGRVLILLPEPLIHQWFVEMLRRFNLLFAIFDQERYESIEAGDPGCNPFLDSQLVICSVGLLEEATKHATHAVQGEWDLVIVDEAHHLEWQENAPSLAYQIVEQIAQHTPGLLLLTATPQQLGIEGHFARLRLIDPDRYASLETFREETQHYTEVAAAVERLLAGKKLTKKEHALFAERSPRVRELIEQRAKREELIAALIDDFGIGRALFRNTRATMAGFPERQAHLVPLSEGDEVTTKLNWLASLLRELEPAKILLICRTRELAEALHDQLPRFIQVKSALFHEGLTLLNRDRNAAYFAEEEGARILICSEIGSEGRNFQFAHHLVLFDLPDQPDLLEQRIGRLDRIGQTASIQIHVPYQSGTGAEVLAHWYREGLNAFEKTPHGASLIHREMEDRLRAAMESPSEPATRALIETTAARHREVTAELAQGNDRLLELQSFKPALAESIIGEIRKADENQEFERFVIGLLDHFGLHLEELAARRWLIQIGHLRTDAFPSLPEEGMTATFDRTTSLSRDDWDFMSIDHPVVRSAIDLFLGDETGNTAFGEWEESNGKALYLEVLSVVECVAPSVLHADRFLPPVPVRVAVDHQRRDCSQDEALQQAQLKPAELPALLDQPGLKREVLPRMLEAAERLAALQVREHVDRAMEKMESQLEGELSRLADLQAMNQSVPAEEIDQLNEQKTALEKAIRGARPRIDAIRLILGRG